MNYFTEHYQLTTGSKYRIKYYELGQREAPSIIAVFGGIISSGDLGPDRLIFHAGEGAETFRYVIRADDVLDAEPVGTRDYTATPAKSDSATQHNAGTSNYSDFKIQPWHIWEEYKLNPWDADIIKRVLRTKEGDSRKLDYEKIIHICQYRLEMLAKDK